MPFTLFFFAASLATLRRFLLRHGWSLLSAHRHKKGGYFGLEIVALWVNI